MEGVAAIAAGARDRAPVRRYRCGLALLGLCLALAMPARAEGWRATDVQVLYGTDFELGSPNRMTVTTEHAQGGAWGDIYVFLDTFFRDDINTELYEEAYLQLSLSWLSGRPVAFGPITDVDLSVSFHASDEPAADPFRAMLAGISFDIAIPGFTFFQFDIHAYKNDDVNDVGVQFTPVWDLSFHLGRVPMRFRGHVDVLSPDTFRGRRWQWLTQPQLLVDVGALGAAAPGHLYAGIELAYWHNKYSVRNVDETVAQAMVMLAF
ncbi:MAG: DUF5020 domain-containing protein [Gammaproteobacteria bacterium]|nr:DUF5020 domain-containing protein [Gammaproteobacteria bacterium]